MPKPLAPLLVSLLLPLAVPQVALAAGAAGAPGLPSGGPAPTGTSVPQALPEVPLIDHEGRAILPSAWRGEWHWLYLGFIHCPDACPRAMDLIAAEVGELPASSPLRPLFLSLDPVRDDPALMKGYTQALMGPRAQAATGPRASLDALTARLGVRYELPATAAPGLSYSVGHPDLLFLLDPLGRPAKAWPLSEAAPAGAIARESLALMASWRPEAEVPGPDGWSTAEAWCGPLGQGLDSPVGALMQRSRTMGSGTALQPAQAPMRMVAAPWGQALVVGMGGARAAWGQGPGGGGPSSEAWGMAQLSQAWGDRLLDLKLHGMAGQAFLAQGAASASAGAHAGHGLPAAPNASATPGGMGEASLRLTQAWGPQLGAFGYLAWGGEPALGPGTSTHRPSAAELPGLPWSQAWIEGGHGARAVGTGGLRWGATQWEASAYQDATGQGLWATRLSWMPGGQGVGALWWSPGGLAGASWLQGGRWGGDRWATTAAVAWRPGQGWAHLAEGQWDRGAWHGALRWEGLPATVGPWGASQLAIARDLPWAGLGSLALGGALAWQGGGPQLGPAWEARAYLRLQPPLMD